MPRLIQAVVKQVPRGWVALETHQSECHPRDGVVLTWDKDNERTPYVVWTVNTIEGGCHNGSYCESLSRAAYEFNSRVTRMS